MNAIKPLQTDLQLASGLTLNVVFVSGTESLFNVGHTRNSAGAVVLNMDLPVRVGGTTVYVGGAFTLLANKEIKIQTVCLNAKNEEIKEASEIIWAEVSEALQDQKIVNLLLALFDVAGEQVKNLNELAFLDKQLADIRAQIPILKEKRLKVIKKLDPDYSDE